MRKMGTVVNINEVDKENDMSTHKSENAVAFEQQIIQKQTICFSIDNGFLKITAWENDLVKFSQLLDCNEIDSLVELLKKAQAENNK